MANVIRTTRMLTVTQGQAAALCVHQQQLVWNEEDNHIKIIQMT